MLDAALLGVVIFGKQRGSCSRVLQKQWVQRASSRCIARPETM